MDTIIISVFMPRSTKFEVSLCRADNDVLKGLIPLKLFAGLNVSNSDLCMCPTGWDAVV